MAALAEFAELRGTSIATAPQHNPVLTCLRGTDRAVMPRVQQQSGHGLADEEHAPSFHESGPEYFSSFAQASGPYLFFHSA